MATTTGKVALNARVMNINGYDCFVNLAKDNKYNTSNYEVAQQLDSPISGFTTKVGFDTTTPKFGSNSFYFQNYVFFHLIPGGEDKDLTFTISAWMKIVNLKSESALSSTYSYAYAQTALNGMWLNSAIFYNNRLKQIGILDSHAGEHVYISFNKNINDGNWHHYASTSQNGQMRLFIDGVKVYDRYMNTDPSNPPLRTFVTIRSYNQTKYIDDVVLILGDCLYISDFTPPSSYLLDSNYNISTNDLKRRNIIASDVDKKLIIPDDDNLKQY